MGWVFLFFLPFSFAFFFLFFLRVQHALRRGVRFLSLFIFPFLSLSLSLSLLFVFLFTSFRVDLRRSSVFRFASERFSVDFSLFFWCVCVFFNP